MEQINKRNYQVGQVYTATGNATDFGDLTVTRSALASCSGS